MDMPNSSPHEQLKHLITVTPDEIEDLISKGKVENLTDKFDDSLESVLKMPGLNPNELMFLDKKTKDKISLLDKEAREAAEEAKKQVAQILEKEEKIPAVTMTEEEVKAMTAPKTREIPPEKKKQLIKDLKQQISEVLGELKKINEEERKTNKEKISLIRESNKTKSVKEKSKIQTKLGRVNNELVSLRRRKENVSKMRRTYEEELNKL